MVYFNNDYSEGCHPSVLEQLIKTNMEQTGGYGVDNYCRSAAQKIKALCQCDNAEVHFLVGGTQTNLTVIDAALRAHQAVLGPWSAHINVHETGAVEATGHKVLSVASSDGKITASQVEQVIVSHRNDEAMEHMAQPKMVYISNPTELGTIYTLAELEAISTVCKAYDLYLFVDGARLGYGLTAKSNDVTLSDLARLCDVFYIGGTKVGALFGEAVVITNPYIARDFRYMIKQHGGMLAKGRLLGVQFDALFTDDLYFKIAKYANAQADTLRDKLRSLGYDFLVETDTNQIFPILPDKLLEELAKEFSFTEQERVSKTHRAVRFCTSWATKEENVTLLCRKLEALSGQ